MIQFVQQPSAEQVKQAEQAAMEQSLADLNTVAQMKLMNGIPNALDVVAKQPTTVEELAEFNDAVNLLKKTEHSALADQAAREFSQQYMSEVF